MKTLNLFKNKEILISLFLSLLIALVFWTGSRYPDLNDKQQMGTRIEVNRIITTSAPLKIIDSDHFFKKIIFGSVNWGHTNRKGMTFGLIFGAAFMTFLLSLLGTFKIKNSFQGSCAGALLGAPLGVCTNCATPIAQSVFSSQQVPSMGLALLQTSPTLNWVVLTMLFSLFPFDFAIFLIALCCFQIFIMTPLISNDVKITKNIQTNASPLLIKEDGLVQITWAQAFKNVSVFFLKNLLFLLKTTLPLMVLSAVLGSLVVELFPFERFFFLEDISFLNLCLLSFIGTLLPVPMTSNVVVAFLLVRAGLPLKLGMTLAFTLGIYSLYPFLVLWKNISKRLALLTFLSIFTLGIISAPFYGSLHNYLVDQEISIFRDNLSPTHQVDQEITQFVTTKCQSFLDHEQYTYCLNETLMNTFVPIVGGKSICNILGNTKEDCQDHIVFRQASTEGQGAKHCDLIKRSNNRDICREKTLTLLALNDENEIYCDDLSVEAKKNCLDQLNFKRSEKWIDHKYCQKIYNSALKMQCHENILSFDQLNSCEYFKETFRYNDCRLRMVQHLIEIGKDIDVCEDLRKNEQSLCYTYFYTYQAIINNDGNICLEKLPGKSFECLFELALSMKNITGANKTCKKMQQKNQIQNCQESIKQFHSFPPKTVPLIVKKKDSLEG